MPKAIQYRANSIIYFKGDVSDRVFILNSGKVVLNYLDIETGQEVHDLITTGEFFGVKSALGKYSREETAVVLLDASVLAFTVPEFELLAQKNTRIIVKMLKVFSNQLRRIHRQVQNLLFSEEQVDPETGLYKIGEYYYGNKQYQQALYAYRRYLAYYPSGQYADEVTANTQGCERRLVEYGSGKQQSGAAPAQAKAIAEPRKAESGQHAKGMTDSAKAFFSAVSLFGQKKYAQALKEFQKLAEGDDGGEYAAKAEYEIGRCLFHTDEIGQCIKTLTLLLKKYPTHPEMKEALLYLGQCYEKKGDTGRARSFFQQIVSMAAENEPVHKKARKALENLGAGG